jgi:hypothetical protein
MKIYSIMYLVMVIRYRKSPSNKLCENYYFFLTFFYEF